MDDRVPYCSIRARFMFANLLIAKRRKARNSQLIDTRNLNPTYGIQFIKIITMHQIIPIVSYAI